MHQFFPLIKYQNINSLYTYKMCPSLPPAVCLHFLFGSCPHFFYLKVSCKSFNYIPEIDLESYLYLLDSFIHFITGVFRLVQSVVFLFLFFCWLFQSPASFIGFGFSCNQPRHPTQNTRLGPFQRIHPSMDVLCFLRKFYPHLRPVY